MLVFAAIVRVGIPENELQLRSILMHAKARFALVKQQILTEETGMIFTTIGSLGSSVLGALFWLIFASLLTVDNYGLANCFISDGSTGG